MEKIVRLIVFVGLQGLDVGAYTVTNGYKALSSKCVFKLKEVLDGLIQHYKIRNVTKDILRM